MESLESHVDSVVDITKLNPPLGFTLTLALAPKLFLAGKLSV